MSDDLSIGQVAGLTGLSVHALRYFEAEGLLLRPVARDGSGRRRFAPEDVEWLLLCNRFRASGMPIETIARFASMVRQGPGNEQQRLDLLREHEREVLSRLDELKEHLTVISAKVSAYEQHLTTGKPAALWDPSRSDSRR